MIRLGTNHHSVHEVDNDSPDHQSLLASFKAIKMKLFRKFCHEAIINLFALCLLVTVQEGKGVEFLSCEEGGLNNACFFESVEEIFEGLNIDNEHLGKSHLLVDDLFEHVKANSERALTDAETVDRATEYLHILDANLDGTIDIYEFRHALHSIVHNLGSHNNVDIHYQSWLMSFVEQTRGGNKVPISLVNLYQLFDEDINGKLTWKEVRMLVVMAELYTSVPQSQQMEEQQLQDFLGTLNPQYKEKGLSFEDLGILLEKMKVDSCEQFFHWMQQFLTRDSERESSQDTMEKTRQQFAKYDTNSDNEISKGELIAALQGHRKDFYTDERANRRWLRADRNQDGTITFNEYAFLDKMKHPPRS